MVLALNADSDPQFRERHLPLAEFVLTRDALLPDPYRVYLAIHDGPYATFAPTMFKADRHDPSDSVAFSAVEQPPLAYIMTFNERDPDARPFLPCGGLHAFGRVPYQMTSKFSIDLLIGFRDSPVPGHYGQGKEDV